MANLDRRLAELENRLRPPPAPLLILVTGMARAGFRYVPTRISLGDGRILDRDDGETVEAFETRAHDLALPSSTLSPRFCPSQAPRTVTDQSLGIAQRRNFVVATL